EANHIVDTPMGSDPRGQAKRTDLTVPARGFYAGQGRKEAAGLLGLLGYRLVCSLSAGGTCQSPGMTKPCLLLTAQFGDGAIRFIITAFQECKQNPAGQSE